MLRHLAILTALLGLPAAATAADYVADLNSFTTTYHCQVFGLLKRIHAHPMTPHKRFLLLSLGQSQRYVQCLFLDGDKRLLCEASSGFYGPRPRHPIGSAARRAIAAQGFSTDGRDGNFQLSLTLGGDDTLWNAAGIMLETLYRGYGARRSSRILARAPLVPLAERLRGDAECQAPAPAG